jgi:hypothetical protein
MLSRKRKVLNRLSGEECFKRFFGFAFLAGYLGSHIFRSVSREAASQTSLLIGQTATTEAERGAAQELQSNAIGQERQPG